MKRTLLTTLIASAVTGGAFVLPAFASDYHFSGHMGPTPQSSHHSGYPGQTNHNAPNPNRGQFGHNGGFKPPHNGPTIPRNDAWMVRQAAGDITRFGGARRLSGDITADLKASLKSGDVHNVILLIGDGMGDSEITIARDYYVGAGGFLPGIDALPLTGQYTHYSLYQDNQLPNYVTDSAASATAWATGTKTYNGALGVDVYGNPHVSLLEMAKRSGYATGDITTAEIQDATPAALYSHISQRHCYGPEEAAQNCPEATLENGGLGSITEQLLNARPDVAMGGGAASFEETATDGRWRGHSLLEQASERGYVIVHNAEELAQINRADQHQPLLGLFADGNMPVNWTGPEATHHGNLNDAQSCEPNPDHPDSQPSLSMMTAKSIQLLQHRGRGFFLQVEGASIDKRDHAADACGQIGETVDLDAAVQTALDFARQDGHTLVIVTSDHAHSSQIIPADAQAPGLAVALATTEGSKLAISYGNSETGSQNHTGTQLRVAAYGPNAANVVGLTDQSDMFFTIRDALHLH